MRSLLLVFIFTCLSFSQSNKYELPFYDLSIDEVHSYTGFTLCFSEPHEQAKWVAYELTSAEVAGTYDRTDDFRFDNSIELGSAYLTDYKGSGYDRGHLAPAADMKWSSTAMSESFLLSNMSPQLPGFNRGVWKRLESQVRKFAVNNQSIYVVTGPILKAGMPSIGSNNVSIPVGYFKVILDYTLPEIKAIGFILKHEKSKESLQSFAVRVNTVEKLTGLDFFHLLPDSIEEALESNIDISKWDFNFSKSSKTTYISTAVQCLGTTQKGIQCKRRTKNENMYCWQHQGQVEGAAPIVKPKSTYTPKKSYASQCLGTTKKGRRCKRKTKDLSGYCWQHK